MALNLYATVEDLKDASRLNISGSGSDAILEAVLEDASRWVDGETRRHFFTELATLYADTVNTDKLLLPDDCLAISALTGDSDGDGTYAGVTLVEDADWYFWPYATNRWPKLQLRLTGFGDNAWPANSARYLKAVGTWGYGDGTSDPWADAALTGAVANTTSESITQSGVATFERGHTIKMGTEQLYVKSAATASPFVATCSRGVNGTTAAIHSTAAISIAQYPARIKQAVLTLATRLYRQLGDEIFEQERLGDYSYKRPAGVNLRQQDRRMFAAYVKDTFV